MNRNKITLFVVFIFFLTAALLPQAAEEIKEKQKEVKKYDASALDDKAREQLNYFMEIKPLIEKINGLKKSGRGGKVFRRKISKLLKQAAAVSTADAQKEYLKALSAGIKSNNFETAASKWLDQVEHKVDIIIKPRPGKQSRRLDLYIAVKRAEYTERAEKYIPILDKMLGEKQVRVDIAPLDISLISPVIVSDAVFSSFPERYVLVFPDDPVKDKPNTFKIVIFSNILEAYFKEFIVPQAKQVLTKQLADSVNFESYLSNIILHRLCYYLGPVFVSSQDDDLVLVKDKLKNMFYYIESIRAEATAIAGARVLVDEKIITEDREKSIYSTYVVWLLRRIMVDPKGKTAISPLFQFNHLLKTGGITFDINKKKFGIDKKKLADNVRKLMMMAAQYERSTNYEEIQRIIKTGADTLPEELKQLLKELRKDGEDKTGKAAGKTGKKKDKRKKEKAQTEGAPVKKS